MKRFETKIPNWIITGVVGLAMLGGMGALVANLQATESSQKSQSVFPESSAEANEVNETDETEKLYDVVEVIDGDTIKIDYEGETTSVRLIGVDTPETVHPEKGVECYGPEASEYLKTHLTGKQVELEADESQSDRDKYDRLLRYVYLDGEDIGLSIIKGGYGEEYTYNTAYAKQASYKQAQQSAQAAKKGQWADGVCNATTPTPPPQNCDIKGNISSSGEKIYHVPGQQYYDKTKIDTSKGERMFCSEEEAVAAGWRKSKV